MPVTSYNPYVSPNGPVAQTGSQSPASPPGVSQKATGYPAIVQTDGTQSPRVSVVTKRAEGNSTPGASSAKFKPSTVQSFNADGV